MNILIIDDEDTIIYLMKHIFSNFYPEIIIHTAMNGDSGLELLKSLVDKGVKLDLAALDVKLPGISGIEMGRKILEKYYNIPVILFTAYYSDDIVEHAESVGIKHIISKKIGLQNVVMKIVEFTYAYKKDGMLE
ncbi:MAG: response regulator [Candidatus Heimdallarchaeaceae archaeon]